MPVSGGVLVMLWLLADVKLPFILIAIKVCRRAFAEVRPGWQELL